MQHRERKLSNPVGNHAAQIYAKGISVLEKNSVARFPQYTNTFAISTFSVTVNKISFLLVQNGVEEGCKLHKFFCKC